MEVRERDYGFSSAQQDEIWRRRRDGESFNAMGRALGAPMHHVRRLPAHRSAEGPALAVFNNRLYCVHRGSGGQSLWWTSFNSAHWSPDTRLPGHLSAQGPAIVSYRGPYGTEDQLFCVHRGHG
ncbi:MULTISPECIES: hypothetical protein [Streptosporangium]|uniref:Uncharacterized protein n=1 Tax=Streptosporangium brasiliense TaxID=47480 RepID=A0ABT9RJZ4_9ACTN|nr:hypothetical protein [Streptosporangium brasiliense]MDP9869059.1 hypothetical protein [Streptosporangium brasiliense]